MEDGGGKGSAEGSLGGVLRGQGSSLWCEVAASTWPQHVAALREAELTHWKRRLGREEYRKTGGEGEMERRVELL